MNSDFTVKVIPPTLAINPYQIYHELIELLTLTTDKITKRKQRLMKVCELLKIEYKDIQCPDVCTKIPSKLKWKKETCSFITDLTSSGTKMYNLSLKVFEKLKLYLSEDIKLRYRIQNKDILFVLKGGCAQKLTLKKYYTDKSEEIDSVFGLGGDNDTCIMINPKLKRKVFKKCLERILDLTYIFLNSMKKTNLFNKINLLILDAIKNKTPEILPVKKRSINLTTGKESGCVSRLYISRQDEYNYRSDKRFALIRVLKSYSVFNHDTLSRMITKSEILDVSILLRNNTSLQNEFLKYRDLEYTYEVNH